MKPFDYEAAKNGAPLQTREGKPARIICWDRKSKSARTILGLVEDDNEEEVIVGYMKDGFHNSDRTESSDDLFMAPTKHKGWVCVYDCGNDRRICNISKTKEEAEKTAGIGVVDIVEIEWKE